MPFTIKKPDEHKVNKAFREAGRGYNEICRGDDPTPWGDMGGWLFDQILPGYSVASGHVAISSDDDNKAEQTLKEHGFWFFRW